MLWYRSFSTNSTNRWCMATKLFWGFSITITPPAQIVKAMRIALLSSTHGNTRAGMRGRTIEHGVSPVTFQNKFKAYKTSIRARSLFDLLTDGIPSSPSGTSKSLPPVPLFTATHDEQQTAKIAIRLLKEDLKINLMARTNQHCYLDPRDCVSHSSRDMFFHSPNHNQQTGSQPAQPCKRLGQPQRSIQ